MTWPVKVKNQEFLIHEGILAGNAPKHVRAARAYLEVAPRSPTMASAGVVVRGGGVVAQLHGSFEPRDDFTVPAPPALVENAWWPGGAGAAKLLRDGATPATTPPSQSQVFADKLCVVDIETKDDVVLAHGMVPLRVHSTACDSGLEAYPVSRVGAQM